MIATQRMAGRRASTLVLAVLAMLSFGAVWASGAQALGWSTGGSYVLGGTSSESVEGSGGPFSIESTMLGEPLQIGCSSASSSGSIVAGGTGSSTISLSGCAVTAPAKCSVGPIALEANTELTEAEGSVYEKFVPASGNTFFEAELSGAECPLNENIIQLHGAFAGSAPGAKHVNRRLTFSDAINSAAGVELHIGKNTPATMSGEVYEHLNGSNSGESWRSLWRGTHGGWELNYTEALPLPQPVAISGGPVELNVGSHGTPVSISCDEVGAEATNLSSGGTEEVGGLTLSNCEVSGLPGCELEGHELRFTQLTGTVESIGGDVYETFGASSEEGVLFELGFQGTYCGNTTVRRVKGSFSAAGPDYGLFQESQPLEFTNATNEAAGSHLTIGYSTGMLTGTVEQSLGGEGEGEPWGVS